MLRIGLLGASRIAPKAVLAPARDTPDVEVVAVAARDGARARAYADEHGIAHAVEGYAALLARDDVDLVYSALPPAEHLQWSVAAARAGKAQLVEKPFALNAAHARAMVEAADAAGRPLLEAFHNRFHPAFRTVERLVAEGRLGRIVHASASFDAVIAEREGELRWIRPLGGGALMDLGCYALHALRTVLAVEPEVVTAACDVQSGVDAATRATLRFGDLKAELSCDMRRERSSVLTLEGEDGRIAFDNYVSPHAFGRLTFTPRGGEAQELSLEGPSTYACQLQHVVEVMAGAAPLTGGSDAIGQMTAIDAIYTAAGLGPIQPA